jgi:hypothetical protein
VDSSLIGKAVIPAAVAGALALARKYWPAAKPADIPPNAPSIDELSSRYGYTQWIVGAAILVVMAVAGWATFRILLAVNQFLTDREGVAVFQRTPQAAIWFFLPFFAGLTLAWDIVLWIWSARGGAEEVKLYRYWTNAKCGFDSTRVLRLMAIGLVVPIAIATILAIPMHTVFMEDHFSIGRYASFSSQRYSYSDIKSLAVVEGYRSRDGEFGTKRHILMQLADGRSWSSDDGRDRPAPDDPQLLSFLQTKSGLEIQGAETDKDLIGR